MYVRVLVLSRLKYFPFDVLLKKDDFNFLTLGVPFHAPADRLGWEHLLIIIHHPALPSTPFAYSGAPLLSQSDAGSACS